MGNQYKNYIFSVASILTNRDNRCRQLKIQDMEKLWCKLASFL
jgi:hypothetical protein